MSLRSPDQPWPTPISMDMNSDGEIESKLLVAAVRCLLITRSPGTNSNGLEHLFYRAVS